jgi:hypothetical protein
VHGHVICLVAPIATGLFLAIHYCPNIDTAFSRVRDICRDVNYGWLLRTLHANGVSLFFVCIYLHTGRNIYYGSYNFIHTWSVGVVILFLTIATAFIGYVLPWGQISFWGATVITNLLSVIPYMGKEVVEWVWGGFAVLVIYRTKIYRNQDCARSSNCIETHSELETMCKKALGATFKTLSGTWLEGTVKKPRNISIRIVGVPSGIRARYLDKTDLLGLHSAGNKLTSPQTESSVWLGLKGWS